MCEQPAHPRGRARHCSGQLVLNRLVSNWRKLETMLTHFPKAVPEIPVSNVEKAAEYYVNALGFHFDWGDDQGGIGGISQGECRMFLTNAPFRQHYGSGGAVMVWLNLDASAKSTNCTIGGGRLGRRSLPSRRINRGTCASSGSPIWTAISCACSTTFPGNCGSKRRPSACYYLKLILSKRCKAIGRSGKNR